MINDFDELISYSHGKFKDLMWCFEKKDGEYVGKTYGEFYADVWAFGEYMLSIGLKGKKIAIVGENSYNFMVGYLAVSAYVGVVVPISKDYTFREIDRVVRECDVDVIIHADSMTDVVDAAAAAAAAIAREFPDVNARSHEPVILINMKNLKECIEKGRALLKKENPQYKSCKKNANELCALFSTSGTASNPKTVMLSQANMLANFATYKEHIPVKAGMKSVLFLPLSHIYAATINFLFLLPTGANVYISSGFKELPEEIKLVRPDVLAVVPLFLEKIIDGIAPETMKKMEKGIKLSNILLKLNIDVRRKLFRPLFDGLGGNIKFMSCGGASVALQVARLCHDMGLVISYGYGLTETTGLVSLNRLNDCGIDSAGKPLENQEVKIVDSDDNGIGEIAVKGDNVMLGYYKNDKLTISVIDENGYFHTGDLGFLDNDGKLYLMGRKKRVIVASSGMKIHPDEIEEMLKENEYVMDAIIYAQDEDGVIVADLVLDKDKLKENGIEDKDMMNVARRIINSTNAAIARYKRIKIFNIIEERNEKLNFQKS